MTDTKNENIKYRNSILIEGDYNYNYLTNILYIALDCLETIHKREIQKIKDRKFKKCFENLEEFLKTSIDMFHAISNSSQRDSFVSRDEERICKIHDITYVDDYNRLPDIHINNNEEEKKDE